MYSRIPDSHLFFYFEASLLKNESECSENTLNSRFYFFKEMARVVDFDGLSCKICGKKFQNVRSCYAHNHRIHPGITNPTKHPEDVIQCTICDLEIETRNVRLHEISPFHLMVKAYFKQIYEL
jgi:hypothetical protein